MNVTNAPLPVAPIPASAPAARRLIIEFDSLPELAIPLTYVHHPHLSPTGPHAATAPVAVFPVVAAPTPHNHGGIND